MSERDLGEKLRRRLREEQVPEADQATERARNLIRSVYEDREMTGSRRASGRRRILQLAVVFGIAAAVASPAGAAVRDWVSDNVNLGREDARPALTSLPARGSLLVESGDGSWVVHGDGSKRLLGRFEDPTWSPRGLFVAATTRHQLVALDPEGEVRWTLTKMGLVSNPSWNRPDGFRVAYLEGDSLRVVAGDGSGDGLLAKRVAPLTPAWRPGPAYELAFARPDGSVRSVAADHGTKAFVIRSPGDAPENLPLALQWSADGRRLLVVRPSGVEIYDELGRLVWSRAAPTGARITGGTFDPDGGSVAIISSSDSGDRSRLGLVGPSTTRERVIFSGPGRFSGLAFSPGGGRLLLGWKSADQWLFLSPDRPGKIDAVSNISRQFAPGSAPAGRSFPDVEGWCCAR